MDRLERFVARRRRLVLVVWIAVVVVAIPFAGRQTENLTGGGFETKGSDSQIVADALAREFPGMQAEDLAVVFDNRAGDPAALAAAIDRVEREGFEDVEAVRLDPEAVAAARAAGGEAVVIMPLVVEGDRDEAVDAASVMRENLEVDEEGAAVPLHLVGQSALWAGIQQLSKEDLEQAEVIGLPIVLIVLLAVFGSLAAAALPLALGVAAVVVTGAIVFFLSQVYGMSIFVTNIASMLGIGVAVDYSLFILARYREELKEGRAPDEAREVALRTSGMAVAFSGVTVIVALAGPVPDRREGRALDGGRRDRRRGDGGAGRRDAAAGADRAARAPRVRAGQDHRPAAVPPQDAAHRPGLLGALDGDADAAPAAVRDRRAPR